MNTIHIDPSDRKQVRAFLELPSRIYRDIPQWVPPMKGENRQRFDIKRYPFYTHSAAAFFLVQRDRIPVARLAVLDNRLYNDHNQEKTAFFYLFECVNDREIAHQLFQPALAWAQDRGLKRMVGPKGFTALDGLGLLVKGFELRPALGLPYNPPYYPDLIESLGFLPETEIGSGYLDANLEFPARIHELADRIRDRRGLSITRFQTRSELRHALGYLKELYNGALEGTGGGTPITDAEIKTMANQILWFADPGLIKIVMKGERPVGFLLAYPDISRALQETGGRLFPFGWLKILRELKKTDWININGAGLIEEYRGLGGTAILYSEFFRSVRSNPRYRHAEVVQIGMENEKMQREMENFGILFNKVHRTYTINIE